ncbi:MAG: SseB family protein [Gammaproteobacteria bacterium]|jgi:hypothetical protein|nr:SseB family protein [Gammaproteobacteria bacterium]MBQ0774267.1 SseB family protein [Gammaproteobacteria bacterium]
MTKTSASSEKFVPENDLEENLLSAQRGSLAINDFILSLLQNNLFIPSSTPVDDGMASLTPLLYESNGKKFLAIFTALNRAKVIRSKAKYCLKIKGKELFLRMPSEYGIVVNPGYRAGLEISASTTLDIKIKCSGNLQAVRKNQ